MKIFLATSRILLLTEIYFVEFMAARLTIQQVKTWTHLASCRCLDGASRGTTPLHYSTAATLFFGFFPRGGPLVSCLFCPCGSPSSCGSSLCSDHDITLFCKARSVDGRVVHQMALNQRKKTVLLGQDGHHFSAVAEPTTVCPSCSVPCTCR